MNYTLPKSVDLGGRQYAIRWDYRAALDICTALSDTSLNDSERAEAALTIFYPDFYEIPEELYDEAIDRCFWFLRVGEKESKKDNGPRLVSWEQDFDIIAPPVSRIVGQDIRGIEQFHWWSFIGAYMEIGDCFFAQVVQIRKKKARGKPLDKQDREFYRKNKDVIDIKQEETEEEKRIFSEWM